jgi:polynucleotide 5'-kinase involved in rRNA processing
MTMQMNADERRSLVIPDAWLELDLAALRGVLLVVGASGTGKSTFAHWLFGQLAGAGRQVAFLDGDVGQSALGPPATLTLALPSQTSKVSKDFGSLVHWFIGDVSPRGRMLPLVVGAGRLARRALEGGAETLVVDTTGLVDPAHGGVALKHALVDQLQPRTLFALQRAGELEPILAPLRRLPRPRVVELPVSPAVRQRGVEARQAHRAAAFRRYFAGAGIVRLSTRGRAIFDGRTFAPRRLLALQDSDGFALALGVVVGYHGADDELAVHAPLTTTDAVAGIRLGAIGVDVATGRELRPGRSS